MYILYIYIYSIYSIYLFHLRTKISLRVELEESLVRVQSAIYEKIKVFRQDNLVLGDRDIDDLEECLDRHSESFESMRILTNELEERIIFFELNAPNLSETVEIVEDIKVLYQINEKRVNYN